MCARFPSCTHVVNVFVPFVATDYDAPRRRLDDEIETDSLEGLKAAEVAGSSMDDDGEVVDLTLISRWSKT